MRGLLIRQFGAIDSHELVEVPDPAPGPEEVLVRVHAIGINFPDLLMLQGKYQIRHPTPFVPGRDASGIVEAVGSGVTSFKPGDRTVCQVPKGAFAEKVAAPLERCFPMSPRADFVTAAAMITPYNTAYVAAVIRTNIGAADTVLITGAAGAVGLAILQLAKHRGAKVIAAVSSDDKARLVREYGADHVVYTRGDNLKEELPAQILALTNERGVDVAFETIGGDVFAAALRSLAFAGRIVVVGFASAQIPEVKTNYLLYRNLAVMGAPLDIHFKERRELMHQGVSELLELSERGIVKPMIAKVVPFESFNDAMRLAADRKTIGRVVVAVQAST